MNTKALRQKVLDLAIHGKLVPQNPNDESATVLLEKIRAEKAEKIKKGELKADKKDSFIFVGSDKRHYEQFADGTVKDIEDEIPFEVPDGWAWCRLSNACSILMGQSPEGTSVSNNTNGMEFHQGKIFFTNKYLAESGSYTAEITRIAPESSLLLCVRAPVGVVNITKREICIGRGLCAIKPNYIIDENFWFYWIQCLKADFEQKATGTTFKAISVDIIKQQLIPLPPLLEQQLIINTIERIFSHIENLEKEKNDLQNIIKQTKSKILDLAIHGKLVSQDPNDEPAEELLKRIATSDNRPYEKVDEEPFEIPDSWEWVKLTSICNKLVDGDHNPPKGIEKQTEYIMASSRNINYDRLDDLENVRYLTKEVFEIENNRTKADKGDIFFTSVGTLGRSCIYSGDYNICFQRSVTVLNTKINNQYLKYYFDSNFYQTYVIEHSTGTAQMGFYLKEMANSPIAIPPMDEQARIVARISDLFFQLDQIQNNLI